MSTVNFYRLEHAISLIPMYQAMLEEPIDFHGQHVRVSGKPGLGVEVSLEAMERYRAEGWEGDKCCWFINKALLVINP